MAPHEPPAIPVRPFFVFRPTATHHQRRPFNASQSNHNLSYSLHRRNQFLRVKKKARTASPFFFRGVMQIKKLKVRPQKSTRSLPPCPSLCATSTTIVHFINFHRSTRGTLRPGTRIDARMLGSHEGRQITRALRRACPDSL